MGNAATAKKGSEVESGESRAGSGDALGEPGRDPERPSHHSPRGRGHGPGLAAAAGNQSWGPGDQLPASPTPSASSGVNAEREGPDGASQGKAVPRCPFSSERAGPHTSWDTSPKVVQEKSRVPSHPSPSLGATGSAVGRLRALHSITWVQPSLSQGEGLRGWLSARKLIPSLSDPSSLLIRNGKRSKIKRQFDPLEEKSKQVCFISSHPPPRIYCTACKT